MKYFYNLSLIRLFSLFAFLCTSFAYAEGSKDLYPSGAKGGRAFLRASKTQSASFPFPTLGTHYVYAKAGERIALATSTQAYGGNNTTRNLNRNNIKLFGPDGQQITLSKGNDADVTGLISGRTAELAGPFLPNETGGNKYRPIYHNVTVSGIYKVEYLGTSRSETGNIRMGYIAADDNWTQTDNSNYLAAWDISVARQNGNTWKWVNGRVYTTVLNMDNQSYSGSTFRLNSGFYGKFKILTRDGYIYHVDNNGNQGISFTFMVNNRGFHVVGDPNTPSYESIAASTAAVVTNRYHDPTTADSGAAVTQKIFYQLPSTDENEKMPEYAIGGPVAGKETWLYIPRKSLIIDDIVVEGKEGKPNYIGEKGAYIKFYNESGGDYFIVVKPKAGSNVSFPTREISGSSVIGENKIYWDGKDGAGESLNSGISALDVSIKLRGAEVHFPYVDMELNANGVIIELFNENLTGVQSDRVFWNDSTIGNGGGTNGSKSNPLNASHLQIPTGTSSNTNGHKWGGTSRAISDTFGDQHGMDTWTFVEGDVKTESFDVDIKIADLKVESVTTDKTSIQKGSNHTYSIVVKNDGPSSVENSPFTFKIPSGFDPVDFTFNGNGCGTEDITLTYNPETHTYTSELALPDKCKITYNITVKATNPIPGDLEAEAAILRPNDVKDPDATNSDPNVPRGTAQEECENNGLETACNNIKTNTIESIYCINPGANGTPDGYTKVGILTKENTTNSTNGIKWPENVPNGYLVMDSYSKGFVITHITTEQRDALTPIDGMLIYNTTLGCVQLYRGTSPILDNTRTGWNCLERSCNE